MTPVTHPAFESSPALCDELLSYPPPRMLVAGVWVEEGLPPRRAIVNPATGIQIGSMLDATEQQLDFAIVAAERAFNTWRHVPPQERARVLRAAAGLLRERRERIARIATSESGKSVRETRLEVEIAASAFDWYAEEGLRTYGRVLAHRNNGPRMLVVKEPVGPVAAFSTWNFPIANPARKMAAALAAGCSCILKPASEAPASGVAVAEAVVDAELPAGVLSVVTGAGSRVASHLIKADVIRKVTFTGSATVGREIGVLAAQGVKRLTLELGGHAPVIVCADVDVDLVVELSIRAKARNAGQICTSPTRFLVHEDVFEGFLKKMAAVTEQLRVGDGHDEATEVGPLIHARRRNSVQQLVDEAVKCGARLITGGKSIDGPGYFYAPTVLADVPADAMIMREEPFGPIAIVNSFQTKDEAVAQANSTPYGLAAYIFAAKGAVARSIAESLVVGMVGLNTYTISMPDSPFGGVKESGFGAEGGIEGMEACLVTKVISEA